MPRNNKELPSSSEALDTQERLQGTQNPSDGFCLVLSGSVWCIQPGACQPRVSPAVNQHSQIDTKYQLKDLMVVSTAGRGTRKYMRVEDVS